MEQYWVMKDGTISFVNPVPMEEQEEIKIIDFGALEMERRRQEEERRRRAEVKARQEEGRAKARELGLI